ncbi:MAG: metal-dependent hydrolase [Bacteroidetes bacterium]|jgi:inner membrane protein|nr:metal-dependent hydrolase [Bacteroidota bacterium]
MASAFGHAYAAIAIGSGFQDKIRSWKFLILGMICSIIPDADVISFSLGIPYESFWGHRGFSHSIFFGILLGILVTALFYKKHFLTRTGLQYILFFSFCTISHGILDALTTGGLGVTFFSPFNNSRYFFPWRPIKVSPIRATNFFGEWGIKVLKSEAIWIGIPASIFIVIRKLIKWKSNDRENRK